MRTRLLSGLAAVLLLAVSLVAGAAASPAADWPTDHGTNLRSGVSTSVAAFTGFHNSWIGHLDGAVYGSPITAGGYLIVATENNTVYSLNATNGALRWAHHLRTPITDTSVLACPGNIRPSGITGSPAFDPVTGRVFVVTVTNSPTTGVTHEIWGLRVDTGATVMNRRVEVPGTDPRAEQQRAALAVDRGNVYIAFGGLWGDCGNYKGAVISLFANGALGGVAYVVPTAREAGIWAPGGPVVAPDGTVYVAVGNGASTGGTYDRSDSVTRLTPRMGVVDYFSPTSWPTDNARDLDLGSLTPAYLSDGQILQVGKSGTGYTLAANHLGHIGGQLRTATLCPSYGVSAVTGDTAYLPCTGGVTRVDVDPSGGMHTVWQQTAVNGSPVAGPGALYVVGGGRLYALSGAHGAPIGSVAIPATTRFATPALYGNRIYVPTLYGVTAVVVG